MGHDPATRFQVAKIKMLDCSDSIRLCEDRPFLTELGDYSCLEAAIKLRSLNLSGREVRDFDWLRGCINLQSLDLSYTDFGDLSLLSGCTRLRTLNLSGCKNLKKEDAPLFRQMTGLKSLDLSGTALAEYGFVQQEQTRKPSKKQKNPPPASVETPSPSVTHSGFSAEEVETAEKRIGVRLPEEYRNYLMQYGKDSVNRRMHQLFPPSEICTSYSCIEEELPEWQEEFAEAEQAGQMEQYADNGLFLLWKLPEEQWGQVTENYVLIWSENQGVWHAGYRLGDLAEGVEHPPIYLSTQDDFITFDQMFASTEDFLHSMFEEAEASDQERPALLGGGKTLPGGFCRQQDAPAGTDQSE